MSNYQKKLNNYNKHKISEEELINWIISQKEILPIIHPISSSEEFRGKVALISGGSGGIGLAIGNSLKESGCTVVIAGTNEKKLEAINKQTGLDTIIMDYSKPDSFDNIIEKVAEKFGKLDIFISSAGVHIENVDFWKISPKEFDRVITNLAMYSKVTMLGNGQYVLKLKKQSCF